MVIELMEILIVTNKMIRYLRAGLQGMRRGY